MTEPIGFDLELSATRFVAGAGEAEQAADGLQRRLAGLVVAGGALREALNSATPSRATLGALGALAAVASASQQRLSQMQAATKITGQSFSALRTQTDALARSFPIGQRGAEQIVQSLQSAGVTAAGSERRLGALSKAVANLGGATGENAAVVGQGLVQISRAFGNTNLDPRRFEKLGDSVTTLSKQTGTSAQAILGFGQAIAPLARSAGIGSTGVLGISAAFGKLGEDGYGAATAVNKVLADMNKSIRDGGSQMDVYAEIVGKTRGEFEALAKANPTEALIQVTEAIGNAGPSGQRQLERIGVEGVRGQRAIQALAAGGELRTAIKASQEGYGSGSTQLAAETAYGGLNDSLTKLSTASEQLAERFGRPLLGPLTGFANLLTKITNAGGGVLGTGAGQGILGAAVWGAIGLAIARRLAGPLLAATAVKIIGGSGLVRSFVGGMNDARYGPGQREGMAGRFGAGMADYVRSGQVNQDKIVQRGWQRLYDLGRGVGTGLGAPRTPIPGQGLGGRLMSSAPVAWASTGFRAYERLSTDWFRQIAGRGFNDPTQRAAASGFRPGWMGAAGTALGGAMGNVFSGGRDNLGTNLRALGPAFNDLHRQVMASSQGMASFRRVLTSTVAMAGYPLAAGARMAGGVLGGAARLAGGPAGVASLGVMAAFYGQSKQSQGQKEFADSLGSRSITQTIDSFRDAMGEATENTRTMSQTLEQTANAARRTVTTFEQARKLTDLDVRAAETGQVTRRFKGTDRQIASQISAVGKLSPRELNSIGVDLVRQGYGRDQAESILGMVDPEGGPMTAGQTRDILKTTTDQQSYGFGRGFYRGIIGGGQGGSTGGNQATLGNLVGSAYGNADARFSAFEVGGRFNRASLSAGQKENIGLISENVATTYQRRSEGGGDLFASQGRLRDVNKIFAEAVKTGNRDVVAGLSTAFSKQLVDQDVNITPEKVEKFGGYVQALAAENKDFGKALKSLRKDGVKLGSGGRSAIDQLTPQARTSQAYGVVGTFFNNSAAYRDRDVNQKVEAVTIGDQTDSLIAQRAAMEAIIAEGLKAGMSLEEVSASLTDLADASSFAGDSTQRAAAAMLRQEATFQRGAAAPFQTRGQAFGAQWSAALDATQTVGDDTESEGRRQTGRQQIADMRGQVAEMLRGRIQANREFQVSMDRQREEYERSTLYAEEDFERSRTYQKEDYERTRFRTAESFGIQTFRAEEGFRISTARAEESYQISRERALRDFNKGIRRQAEDGAKSMYDPYRRITIAATWDTQNLVVNLRQQNAEIQRQSRNLAKARKMGLSQETISQLRLDQADQAQQLARIVGEADTQQVGALNAATRTRVGAASSLLGDVSNTDRQRQIEDFRRGLEVQSEDYQRSMAIAREDFARQTKQTKADYDRSMKQMSADNDTGIARAQAAYDTSIERSATAMRISRENAMKDFQRSQQEIVVSYNDLNVAITEGLDEAVSSWSGGVVDGLDSVVQEIQKRTPNILGALAMAGLAPAGAGGSAVSGATGTVDLTGAGGASAEAGRNAERGAPPLARGSSTTSSTRYKQMESIVEGQFPWANAVGDPGRKKKTSSGRTSLHSKGRAVDISPPNMALFDWLSENYPNSTELFYTPAGKRQINNGGRGNTSGKLAADHYDHIHWAMARGGIATQPTKTLIGEAGRNEAIIPLDQRGVNVLAMAFQRYMSMNDLQRMTTSAARSRIVYDYSTTSYDQSTKITGPITVKATDPDMMAKALAERRRRANLTATPTRKR